MATIRKTITITERQNAWIAAQIEAVTTPTTTKRSATSFGEQSGEPEKFDFTTFKRRKVTQHV